MSTVYHQLQGLYTAGDVLCAVDCVRALPDYRHVFFVNHDDGFDYGVLEQLRALDVDVRHSSLVSETDLNPDLCAVFYHCVGHDDSRRGEYVRFRQEPPGVALCAWIQTPGLCGTLSERYNYLSATPCSTLVFNSSFTLHNTPGIDLSRFARCAIVNPVVNAVRYAGITRVPDGVFRIGRWSRGADHKYSDDFLDLVAGIEIPGLEVLCMGIPGKFRGAHHPSNVRMVENGAMPVEELLSRLDLLIFKTDASSWHEGWCRTVTEAMAAGVVPVVENRGGVPDQVIPGYNGFLCDDNADFQRYCALLYHDPALRARLGANARAFAGDNFSLPNLRRDLLALIAPRPPRRLDLAAILDAPRHCVPGGNLAVASDVDLVPPLDPFYPRLPFADDQFDEIQAYHVLEHVANKAAIVEEVWRIARHNAVIRIKLPDRNHGDAFLDPTHLSYWEVDTVDFFLPGHPRQHCSPAKFGLLRKHTTGREIYWELLAIKRH